MVTAGPRDDVKPAVMTNSPAKIREWHDVDRESFRNEIVRANQPAVLRGLVRAWPAVQTALRSPESLHQYLARFDAGGVVKSLVGPPSIEGRFFYQDDMRSLNFERRPEPLRSVLEQMMKHLFDPQPPALAIQAAPVPEFLPGLEHENVNPLLDASITPRIWIGNAITVVTHADPTENIACVVAGRRRFTLFPPDQVANLYVGPFELTPAGTPVSMVSVIDPELDRYPRFRQALACAQTAELEPGDALYIPYLWWHHVQSLESFNVLMNYWWNPPGAALGSPFDAIFHGMLTLGGLPLHQRTAWRAMFDHYVFRLDGEPAAHLPREYQGVLAPMTPELAARLKAQLQHKFKR
jgi:Cupin-like domain